MLAESVCLGMSSNCMCRLNLSCLDLVLIGVDVAWLCMLGFVGVIGLIGIAGFCCFFLFFLGGLNSNTSSSELYSACFAVFMIAWSLADGTYTGFVPGLAGSVCWTGLDGSVCGWTGLDGSDCMAGGRVSRSRDLSVCKL